MYHIGYQNANSYTLSTTSNQLNSPQILYPNQYPAYQLQRHPFHNRVLNVEDIVFPLSTSKTKIVDAMGKRVKLAGVNWSGAHMCRHCVDGLEFRKLREICQ